MDKVDRGTGEDREDKGREITIDEESRKPSKECEASLCVPGSPFPLAI